MKPTLNQTPDLKSFPKPQKDSKFIIKCILAILLIASGLLSVLIFNSVLSGSMRIIAGLLLFPPTLKVIESGIKVTLNRTVRYITIVLLVQVSLIISFYKLIEGSGKNKLQGNQADTSTKTVKRRATSKTRISEITDATNSENDSIPIDSLNKLAEEEKPLVEKQKREEEQNKKFQEQHLSGWDGSFRPLVKYVKDNMNDPNSFEYVSTNFWGQGDHVLIVMKFRGNNAFGVKVLNSAKAIVDWNGRLIKVLE